MFVTRQLLQFWLFLMCWLMVVDWMFEEALVYSVWTIVCSALEVLRCTQLDQRSTVVDNAIDRLLDCNLSSKYALTGKLCMSWIFIVLCSHISLILLFAYFADTLFCCRVWRHVQLVTLIGRRGCELARCSGLVVELVTLIGRHGCELASHVDWSSWLWVS